MKNPASRMLAIVVATTIIFLGTTCPQSAGAAGLDVKQAIDSTRQLWDLAKESGYPKNFYNYLTNYWKKATNDSAELEAYFKDFLAHHNKSRFITETNSDLIQPYDIVIPFPSITDVSDPGWLIERKKTITPLFEMEMLSYAITAVVGLFDVGKTWLINLLAGQELPSGFLVETKGISLLFPQSPQVKTVFCDTQGWSRAAPYEKVKDRLATEHFVNAIATAISHYVIYVAELLTIEDQRHIHHLINTLPTNKKLIIVHNMQKLYFPDEVDRHIHTDIVMAYNASAAQWGGDEASESTYWESFHTTEVSKEERKVHHYVFAHAWTPAGIRWNDQSLRALRSFLSSAGKLHQNGELIQQYILEAAAAELPRYFFATEPTNRTGLLMGGPTLHTHVSETAPNMATHISDASSLAERVGNGIEMLAHAGGSLLKLVGAQHLGTMIRTTGTEIRNVYFANGHGVEPSSSTETGFTESPFAPTYEHNRIKLASKRELHYFPFSPYAGDPDYGFKPQYDILRLPDTWMVIIDLPGVVSEDIEIWSEYTYLHVRGKRAPAEIYESAEFPLSARKFGFFELTFALPKDVREDFTSSFVDGALAIVNQIKKRSDPKKPGQK